MDYPAKFDTGLPVKSSQLGVKHPNSGKKTRNGEAAFYMLLYHYKFRAKKKGLEFSLTDSEFKTLTSALCYYCGSEPAQIQRKHATTSPYVYNGIDRVDNAKGYVTDNVRTCCGPCNWAKHQQSEAEFLAWIQRLCDRWRDAKPE
jgi:hypothetical protein